MASNGWFAKILRLIGIVLMAITGGFTIFGGIGLFCVALAPEKYGSMAALAPFQWLYILFMVGTTGIGIWGLWATILLIRGTPSSYKMSVLALVSGVLFGGFHIFMSRMLRGASMPVDAVVYTTLLTLAVFLLFRIPAIWQGVDFNKANRKDSKKAGAVAAIMLGILTLTIQYMMASTHTFDGVNYANAFNVSMTLIGIPLFLLGLGLLLFPEKDSAVVAELGTQTLDS